MSISTITLRVSRALHKTAVRFHCKALRLSVIAADAKANAAHEEHAIALSAVFEASRMQQRANENAIATRERAYNLRIAAATEANQLGGSL